MPRSRKQSATTAYDRRNQRARALGYKSYYDYRAHDNGRLPPKSARLSGPALARARGHRSAADLKRAIKPGSILLVEGSKRDPKTGEYQWIDIRVVDENGRETVYRLRGKQTSTVELQKVIDRAVGGGAVISPVSSLDIRSMANQPPIADDEPDDDLVYNFSDDDIPF